MIIKHSSLKLMVNTIPIIVVAMFMAFWLSSCSVTPSSTVQTEISVDPLAYQDCVYPSKSLVAACQKQGGDFIEQGMLRCYSCVLKYDDAGKACQDSADCLGSCQNTNEFVDSGTKNQSGQCSADNSRFGCRQTIEKGIAQPAICVD